MQAMPEREIKNSLGLTEGRRESYRGVLELPVQRGYEANTLCLPVSGTKTISRTAAARAAMATKINADG